MIYLFSAMKKLKPTESELAILGVLWTHGPSTVKFVNEHLNAQGPEKEIGYTTTLKLMQIMHEKEFLARKKNGRMHIYSPLITQKESQQNLVNELLDSAFQGSAMKLVMQALGNRRSTPQELDEIRAFLDQLEENPK